MAIYKKYFTISVFVFLVGLFAGLFFCTGISASGNHYLTNIFKTSIADNEFSFFSAFFRLLIKNIFLIILILPALCSKILCPLPQLILWYKAFAIGFCNGLIYLGDVSQPVFFSLTRVIPSNLFIIPAFIFLTTFVTRYSYEGLSKRKRSSTEIKDLKIVIIISLSAIVAGCFIEALFHLIVP